MSLYEHRALLVEPVSRPLSQLITPFQFLTALGKPRENISPEGIAQARALLADWFGDRSLEARLEAESRAGSTARWEQAQREQREAKARAAKESDSAVKWASDADMLARLDKRRARDGGGAAE